MLSSQTVPQQGEVEEPVIITERIYNESGGDVRRYTKGRLLGKVMQPRTYHTFLYITGMTRLVEFEGSASCKKPRLLRVSTANFTSLPLFAGGVRAGVPAHRCGEWRGLCWKDCVEVVPDEIEGETEGEFVFSQAKNHRPNR